MEIRIEGNFCGLDELSLGLFMAYGEDEYGPFHSLTIGLIFFEISLYNYDIII